VLFFVFALCFLSVPISPHQALFFREFLLPISTAEVNQSKKKLGREFGDRRW